MLGKSVEHPARPSLLIALGVLSACPHNVPQEKASGEDGRVKGAKPIEFENGQARATGIVTYPGGDRVDWKLIELPEKQKGTLDIKLTWTPPRPGLQLAFDVFDEWNHPVGDTAKKGKRRGAGRSKSATIDGAKGKYFIRVYAAERGDAGKYRLTVDFKEASAGPLIDWLKVEIAEPPKLAAVPEPEVPCDPTAFDPKLPACKLICPEFGAPPGWPACKDVCPTPPNVELPSCQKTMPCPNPPDRRVKACTGKDFPKCPDINNPDPKNPNCDNAKADPVTGRVMKTEVQGGEIVITVSGGGDNGVKKGWRGAVLRGATEEPLPGGEVTIVRIDKGRTIGKVKLTVDQLKANDRVKLSPP